MISPSTNAMLSRNITLPPLAIQLGEVGGRMEARRGGAGCWLREREKVYSSGKLTIADEMVYQGNSWIN